MRVVIRGSRRRRLERSTSKGNMVGQEKNTINGQMYNICERWIVAMWLVLSPRTTPPFQKTKAANDAKRTSCGQISSRIWGRISIAARESDTVVVKKSVGKGKHQPYGATWSVIRVLTFYRSLGNRGIVNLVDPRPVLDGLDDLQTGKID